jgi:transcriptional regulator with XRE-family HTH domain
MAEQRLYRGPDKLDTPGQRIRFLRHANGLSQEALASKVYATQPAVSQWESDQWMPTKQTQVLLAEALNTTRAFLFGEAVA